MRHLKLNDIFICACAKRLVEVDINPENSNQHEFNGVKQLSKLFGKTNNGNKKRFHAMFIYLDDNEKKIINDSGKLTWYDARWKNPNRSENRLYFTGNQVIESARVGDLMIIASLKGKNIIMVVIARKDSTIENQLIWLFQLGKGKLERFIAKDFSESVLDPLNFSTNFILDSIGIQTLRTQEKYLEKILERFPAGFPRTKQFSEFTCEIVQDNLDKNPDNQIMLLMDTEEILFKTLEKFYLEKKLVSGFTDPDDFVDFSLSFHNRRKSRAGRAFENHLEYIFKNKNIKYDRNKFTENKSNPDFIFPGIKEYRDFHYPKEKLSMLGVKTTLKDRWRQIIPEANRIENKHLATLQPAISENQTDEIEKSNVTLVVPEAIQSSFKNCQKKSLMSLSEFIELLKFKEKKNS